MDGACSHNLALDGPHGCTLERSLKNEDDLVGICAAMTFISQRTQMRVRVWAGWRWFGQESEYAHKPSLEVSALTTLSNEESSRCSMQEQTSNIAGDASPPRHSSVKRRMSPTFSNSPSLVTDTTRPFGSADRPNGRVYVAITSCQERGKMW